MNEKIEAFYPLLGQNFYDSLPSFSEAWLTFESIGDVWGAESFYKTSTKAIRYKNEGLEAAEKLLCGMRQAFVDSNLEPFSQVVFHLRESGKFTIDYGYEDVSDFGLSGERRALWIEKTFGKNTQVQWS
jgi:Protein of unknown function, DUF600